MERKTAASSRLIKLVCVGDSAVGKSSLIERAVLGTWNSDQQTTIGLEFYRLALKLPGSPATFALLAAALTPFAFCYQMAAKLFATSGTRLARSVFVQPRCLLSSIATARA
jgi:hypothetical protein